MTESILIRGGRVIDPAADLDDHVDLLLRDGVVAALGHDLESDGVAIVDASGAVVAPGFVDLHAHLREPGFEQKGTIATETLAALRGGFTAICAMPNTTPAPDSASVVESLRDRIARDAHVRVFPIGCVTSDRAGTQLAELAEIVAAGCVALSDDGSPVADARIMRNALLTARELGVPISEHSDDPTLNPGGLVNEGVVSERLGLAGQPAAAEVMAIARDLALAESTGAHLHVAHVSVARSLDLIAEAKARGVRVTCEVTPSHLFLTEEAVAGTGDQPAYDTNARINPPLRTEMDRLALVAAVNSGLIDAIATDHAPHAIEDKLCEFDMAAPGISCFETAFGTIGELVHRGELELIAALRALTATPSALFALDRHAPGVGRLEPGVSSDVVIIRPAETWTVDTSTFASKGRNTPLHGTQLTGRVVAVIAGGRLAYTLEPASA